MNIHSSVASAESRRTHAGLFACLSTSIAFIYLLSGSTLAEDGMGTSNYLLGPGDQILINVFGEEDLKMDFRLNDTGTLNYPFLGELTVAGLSVPELEQLISSGLKGPYLIDPDVTVSIKEYRPFFLHGEVRQPGGFPFQPGLTLEKAVALSGGFTERASKRKITVIRGNEANPEPTPIKLNDRVYADDVITVHQGFF